MKKTDLDSPDDVRQAIASGRDVNSWSESWRSMMSSSASTPVSVAISKMRSYDRACDPRGQVLRALLDAGADVNRCDEHPDGATPPLFWAAARKQLPACELLLAFGADASIRGGDKNETPLELAKFMYSPGWGIPGDGQFKAVVDVLELAQDAEGLQRLRAKHGVIVARPGPPNSSLRRVRHNCLTLYHVTNGSAARAIVSSQQMRRGSGGAAGGAIYFARTPADAQRKSARGGDVCLVADVWMGRSKVIDSIDPSLTFGGLQQEGYDSVWLTALNGDELVVYNYDQVENIRRVEF